MNINISFSLRAWDEYLIWQAEDKNGLRKINALLKDIARNGPLEGIGRPEALKGELAGYYSRRINGCDRLVYGVSDGAITVLQCRGHY